MSDSYQWIWIVLGVLVLHVFCTRLAASPPPPKYGPPRSGGPVRDGSAAPDGKPLEDDWSVTREFGLGGGDTQR